MDDKVNPPSKPDLKPPPHTTSNPPPPSKPNPATNLVVPVAKSPLGGHRPVPSYYRQRLPQPPLPHQKRRRNCCCRFFFWLILFLFALVFLIAITGGIMYLLVRPYRPNFSISSLEFVSLNLTNSSQLSSSLDLTVVAYNPNTKLKFIYDPISIAASHAGVQLGAMSFAGFVHETENSTKLRGMMEGVVDDVSESVAKSVKRERILKVNIEMETKVEGEIWGIKLRDIEVIIFCGGFRVANPMNRGKAIATPGKVCEVKLYIQLLNWEF